MFGTVARFDSCPNRNVSIDTVCRGTAPFPAFALFVSLCRRWPVQTLRLHRQRYSCRHCSKRVYFAVEPACSSQRFGRGILKLCVHVQSPSAHPHTPRTPPHAAHLRACTHVYAPECTCARVRTHGPVTCPCATALSCTCTHPCTNICARMHAHMCAGGRRTLWMPNSWVLQCRDGSRPNGSLCRPYIQKILSYLACLHV